MRYYLIGWMGTFSSTLLPMRYAAHSVVLAWMMAYAPSTGTAAPSTTPKYITIRTINGKTGLPVWWRASPIVCVGTANNDQCSYQKGNLAGNVRIDISKADVPTVTVAEDFISRDCRDAQRGPSATDTYSIPEIIAHGIVAKNFCGSAQTIAKPGTLVIFVIPMSFKELWEM